MKKIIVILFTSIVINLSISAQSVGDYRSIGTGNWNDATKWEIYNGSNWISSNSYPGQNPGTGAASIMNETEITITASVHYPVSSLYINADLNQLVPSGKLEFSSENAVSLTVSETVTVYGSLIVGDQIGTKEHSLFIGGGLQAGTWIAVQDPNCVVDPECWDCYCPTYYYPIGGEIKTVNNDDKLGVLFNTTNPNSWINGSAAIAFQDVSFNGIGISVGTSVYINGTANFINGIVRSDFCGGGGGAEDASSSPVYYNSYPSSCSRLFFNDGAIAVGASARSFVDGRVLKQGDDPFTFPIGNGGVYSPLTASIPAGQVATLSARYARSDAAYPISSGISDPGLYSVSDCEYWELNPVPSSYGNNNVDYPVDITVGWGSSSGCSSSPYVTGVSAVTLARLNFYGDEGWDSHGGSATGTIQNGTVTWTGIKSLGTFTLGNINTNCVPPSMLTTTNITTNSASLNWSIVPGAVSYDVNYKRNTTEYWTNMATSTTATSLNLSGLNPLDSYDWRVRANCNSSSSAYRLAKFTTQNPCGTPSGLNTTNITLSSATLNWSPVTNATNYTIAYKESNSTSWVYAAFGIGSPSYTLTGLSAATSYDWEVYAQCSDAINYITYGGGIAQASFTTLACNDVYEPNNTSNQAKTIILGTAISTGISSATDVDWFKVTTPNNSNIVLEITLSNLPADYDLYVYDKNLVLVGSSTTTGTSNEVVIYNSNIRKTTYYIKVMGKNGAYNTSQCYNLLAQVNSSAQSVSRASYSTAEITYVSDDQSLYPNPVSEFVFLRFNSVAEGAAKVQILNSTGQLVKLYSVNLTKGYNQVRISVTDIKPGMYLLKINKDELNMIRKFVITR
jgi:hypothetical protein